eukprot:3043655-Prymnesium_polylepis.1
MLLSLPAAGSVSPSRCSTPRDGERAMSCSPPGKARSSAHAAGEQGGDPATPPPKSDEDSCQMLDVTEGVHAGEVGTTSVAACLAHRREGGRVKRVARAEVDPLDADLSSRRPKRDLALGSVDVVLDDSRNCGPVEREARAALEELVQPRGRGRDEGRLATLRAEAEALEAKLKEMEVLEDRARRRGMRTLGVQLGEARERLQGVHEIWQQQQQQQGGGDGSNGDGGGGGSEGDDGGGEGGDGGDEGLVRPPNGLEANDSEPS